MCIRTVNIDQARLSRINPSFKDVNVIDAPSPNAHTAEEMRSLLVERVRRAEAGEEKAVSNQAVFDTIRDKYGF